MSDDFEKIDAGRITVQVKYRDPSYENERGELFYPPEDDDWRAGPDWLLPDDCEHSETMCAVCLETWQIDHRIRLTFEDHDGTVVDVDEMRAKALEDDSDG